MDRSKTPPFFSEHVVVYISFHPDQPNHRTDHCSRDRFYSFKPFVFLLHACVCVRAMRFNDFDMLDILQFSVPKHENINKYSIKLSGKRRRRISQCIAYNINDCGQNCLSLDLLV